MDSDWRLSWRKIESWCGQLLCLSRLIHRTFLFQKICCQKKARHWRGQSHICGGALQYSILLRKIMSMNKGWVNPWLKALVRGLASLSACAVDLSGCQVARVKSTRVWFLIYFLNIFNDYSTIEWFVSAWIIWGLRAEWMLNLGTEASKGWLFCGDAARSRISQDRKNVFFFWEIVHIVLLNICRTVVWSQQQLCVGRPLGFVSNWRNN